MTSLPTLHSRKRELSTNGHLNQIRRNGFVPGVLYGKDNTNQMVQLEARDLMKVFAHTSTRGVFMLEIEGEKNPYMVLIRELQKNPISHQLTHIDFLQVKSNEKIHNKISIHLIGEDELIEQGKLLQVFTLEMEVAGLPAEIPDRLSFDVSKLNTGDKVVMADIVIPASIELVEDPATVICSIAKQETEPEPEPQPNPENAEVEE